VCSLVGATNELKAIFAADPPVRAKPPVLHSTSAPSLAGSTAFLPAAPTSAPAAAFPQMTAAVPPPAYGQHHGVSPTATGIPAAGPGSSPAAFPVVPPPAYGHHPQQQHHAPYPSSSSATTTPTSVTSAPPPTGAMGALQQPQRSSQSQARDALLSTVGQRYSDLRKVVELEAEKVRTRVVPCAVCRVPCAVCRVPCAVCRVSFLSKTRTNQPDPSCLQKRLTAEYKEVKDMVSQIKRSNRRKEDEPLNVDAATNPRNPKELTYGPLPHTTTNYFYYCCC
jgi:hypothetical protein